MYSVYKVDYRERTAPKMAASITIKGLPLRSNINEVEGGVHPTETITIESPSN